MTTWGDLYIQKGTYISQPFDVSSGYEYYVHNIKYEFDKNDGVVDFYIRISYDGNEWGDWVRITEDANETLFRDDFYYLESCQIQFKAVLVKNGDVSPLFKTYSFDLYGSYLFYNNGDVVCKPEMWIKKINGSGSVTIINETNDQQMIIENLNDGETVYIDCENEDIATDLPEKYRYNDHNNVFLEFEIGENVITGEGDFELVIRYEFKTLQG